MVDQSYVDVRPDEWGSLNSKATIKSADNKYTTVATGIAQTSGYMQPSNNINWNYQGSHKNCPWCHRCPCCGRADNNYYYPQPYTTTWASNYDNYQNLNTAAQNSIPQQIVMGT